MTSRRGVQLVLLAVVLVIMGSDAAGAHTALVSSSPPSGSSMPEAPETLSLVFAEPVDPGAVRVEVLRADGRAAPQPELLTTGTGATELVEFTLGDLASGVHGLAWETIGPDGHRVFGEVIVGVGTSGLGELVGIEIADQAEGGWLARLLLATRVAMWVAFFLAVGVFVLRTCGLMAPVSLDLAASVLGVAWLLRGAVIVWSLASVREGGLATRAAESIASRTGAALLLGLVGALLVSRAARSNHQGMLRLGGFGILLVALGATVNGHGVLLSDQPYEVWFATAHVVAAAVWVGPVLLLAVVALRSRQFDADAVAGLRRHSGAATVSVVVLAITGVRAMVVTAGGLELRGTYGALLAVKLAVVGVALLFGVVHGYGLLRRVRPPSRPTMVLEAAAMVVVVVVVSLLATETPSAIDPAPSPGNSPLAQVLDAAEVRDVDACGSLEVGRITCYNQHLATLLVTDGAGVALAEVQRLVDTDTAFALDCHQYAHDLGNIASTHYDLVGEALAFDGTVCGSGYYHGLLEQAIGGLVGADELRREVTTICPGAGEPEAGVVAFQCVHGVGHGMMLNLDDVAVGATVCAGFEQAWAQSTCVGGVQMENIMSFYNTEFVVADGRTVETTPDFSDTNPYHPCDALASPLLAACFEQHASYLLLSVANEPEEAGTLCAGAPGGDEIISSCFAGLGRHLLGDVNFDGAAGVALCAEATTSHLGACIIGAMRTALNHTGDDSLAPAVCAAAPEVHQASCNEELAARLAAYQG